MDPISRRHLLTGTATVALSTAVPAPILTIARNDGIGEHLRIARELLADLEMEASSCACYEAVAEGFPHWGLTWEQSYVRMVSIADDLRQFITDDTPETRAILTKARAIVPPACERAETYWQPIPNLSRKFRKAWKRYFYWRANRIAYCNNPPPHYQQALADAESDTLQLHAKTPGDWELKRRMLQSWSHDEMHDIAHLRARLSDWKSFIHDDFETRCGALPCKRCEQWFA